MSDNDENDSWQCAPGEPCHLDGAGEVANLVVGVTWGGRSARPPLDPDKVTMVVKHGFTDLHLQPTLKRRKNKGVIFRFQNLPVGEYTVEAFEQPSPGVFTSHGMVKLLVTNMHKHLRPEDDQFEANIVLKELVTLIVHVVASASDINGNALPDEPVPPARVEVDGIVMKVSHQGNTSTFSVTRGTHVLTLTVDPPFERREAAASDCDNPVTVETMKCVRSNRPIDYPEVKEGMRQAWRDSQSADDAARHEEGGYIVATPNFFYLTARWPPGGVQTIAPAPRAPDGSFNGMPVMGDFHTHPHIDGLHSGPPSNPEDYNAVKVRNYPSLSYVIGKFSIWSIDPVAVPGSAVLVGPRAPLIGD